MGNSLPGSGTAAAVLDPARPGQTVPNRPKDHILTVAIDRVGADAGIFASFTHDSLLSDLLISDPRLDMGWAFDLVVSERTTLQAPKRRSGPAVAQTRSSVAPYSLGLTITYRPTSAKESTIILLRGRSSAEFAPGARRAAAEVVREWAAGPEPAIELTDVPDIAQRRPAASLFLFDPEFRLLGAFRPPAAEPAVVTDLLGPSMQLPAPLIERIHELTKAWDTADSATLIARSAIITPGVLLRVAPMTGPGGIMTAVTVEPFRTRRSLGEAAKRYALSERQIEVLQLLFDGFGHGEIADLLSIAESTVQDHVKQLIVKTGARNRIEMTARLLGWPGSGR